MQPVTYRFSKSPPVLDVLSLLSLALFVFPLLMATGILLRWLEVPGTEWIKSQGTDDVALFWAFLVLAVIMGVFFVLTLAWKSPARNFLLLDDVGLTYACLGMRRRWPWRAMQPAELEQTGVPLRVAKLAISGRFGWIDRLGLLFLNTLASSSQATLRLPDFYEAPIEEIVARINDYRALALGGMGAARTTRPAGEGTPTASTTPVVFAKSTVMYRRLRLVQNLLLALTFPFVAVGAYLIHLVEDKGWIDVWSAGAAALGLAIAMLVIVVMLQRRANLPEYNNLRLDEDGLVYTRVGRPLRWSWDELSRFTLEVASSRRLLGRRRFITFGAPGRNRTWRLLRWLYGLPLHPPLVLIEDIYQTPLEEIAETLNAFRDRAARGGATA